MTKSRVFLVLSLSFIAGILGTSFFKIDSFWIYVLAIIAIVIITLGYKNKIALIIGLAFLFLIGGIWRMQSALQEIKSDLDGQYLSQKVVVVKKPEKKDNYQNVVVRTNTGEKILFQDNINSVLNYGDEIDLKCLLKIPSNKDNFNYRMYLAKDKIFYLCQKADYFPTGRNLSNQFYGTILKIGTRLEESVNKVIPQPQAALANGLLLGGSDRMSKNWQEKFSLTGMTHIVAVSGYNVSIIAEYLMAIFIFIGLWRKQAFWAAVIGIILFVIMIGYPSSAIRAGVMGTLLLWAMKNGRLANSTNAVVLAAAIMLAINPLLLRWDIGFQLSFLATIGIVALAPVWENYFIRKAHTFGLLEIMFLTLSAQIFVIPILLSNFGSFSPISLLANVLVLPIVPVSMFFSFLTALTGIFSYELSLPFAWLAYLLLKYETEVVEILFNAFPNRITTDNLSWFFSLLWYGILTGFVIFLRKKINVREKARLWNFNDIVGT